MPLIFVSGLYIHGGRDNVCAIASVATLRLPQLQPSLRSLVLRYALDSGLGRTLRKHRASFPPALRAELRSARSRSGSGDDTPANQQM